MPLRPRAQEASGDLSHKWREHAREKTKIGNKERNLSPRKKKDLTNKVQGKPNTGVLFSVIPGEFWIMCFIFYLIICIIALNEFSTHSAFMTFSL